jgi:hypothetical protein
MGNHRLGLRAQRYRLGGDAVGPEDRDLVGTNRDRIPEVGSGHVGDRERSGGDDGAAPRI